MDDCLIGCCGWSEAQSRYVDEFPVIEIQSTFYEPPSLALAMKWRALAPESFQFCIKAWQLITHEASSPTYRKLKSPLSPSERDLVGAFRPTEQVWHAWERTQAIAEVLRASVIVFQCPASFRPTPDSVRNMRAFFERIERGAARLAWEPRGEWPAGLIRDVCAEFNLIHCVDPFTAETVYGDVAYWRLHGRNGYSYRYTEEDLHELREKLRHAAATPAYILFNNIRMKEDARRFQVLLTSDSRP